MVDEARHVEAYARLLHEKFALTYPINPRLKRLLNDTLVDARWDFTYLGMQVLIEGVALAAFGVIRDQARNPLARAVTAYVMQDEARHVAFGRLALRDYYPQLSEKERDEREEFVVEGCYLLRDRFLAEEVWETLGLPVEQCKRYVEHSELMRVYRSNLFMRIVPTIKDIGLWVRASRRPTPTWASSISPTPTWTRSPPATSRSRRRSMSGAGRSRTWLLSRVRRLKRRARRRPRNAGGAATGAGNASFRGACA